MLRVSRIPESHLPRYVRGLPARHLQLGISHSSSLLLITLVKYRRILTLEYIHDTTWLRSIPLAMNHPPPSIRFNSELRDKKEHLALSLSIASIRSAVDSRCSRYLSRSSLCLLLIVNCVAQIPFANIFCLFREIRNIKRRGISCSMLIFVFRDKDCKDVG